MHDPAPNRAVLTDASGSQLRRSHRAPGAHHLIERKLRRGNERPD